MSPEILKTRTYKFALSVLEMVDEMPKTVSGEVVGRQLIRSATSVGANYRAACKAKSTADFVNKLKIVEEEADESEYWLSLIKDYKKFKIDNIDALLKEANELNKIFSASAKTAKSNKENNTKIINTLVSYK